MKFHLLQDWDILIPSACSFIVLLIWRFFTTHATLLGRYTNRFINL